MAKDTIPVTLAEFDKLPDSALIDVRSYALLLSCSENTIWRRARQKTIPAPIRVSTQQTRWRVGDVRRSLAALSSQPEAA